MEQSYQAGKPASQTTNHTNTPVKTHQGRTFNHGKTPFNSPRRLALIIIGLALVLLVATVGYLFVKQNQQTFINKNAYQAVFLTNGQVYFGKVQSTASDYLKLTDVYYLQVEGAQTTEAAAKDATTDANTKLVKLGEELHAPEDELIVNKEQILFLENLKDSGKVAQAIKAYQDKK